MSKISFKRILYLLIDALFIILLILLDQFTKRMAVTHLMNKEPFVLWKGVLELQYLENSGAAFGILQDSRYFFIATSIIVLLIITYFYFKLPLIKKYVPLKIVLLLIFAGAFGNNLIDRIRYSYVIDFIYFKLINFPIFNAADCYVVIAAILLIVLILFVYKDEDLNLFHKRKDVGENNE